MKRVWSAIILYPLVLTLFQFGCAGAVIEPKASTSVDALAISTISLPAGSDGGAYSATVGVVGGIPPYKYSISSGSLPLGLALNSHDGVISGTVAASGTFDFTAWVTDSADTSARANLSIAISGAGTGISVTSSKAYGPGIASDGLANTTVGPHGNTVSYRFLAKHSGPLEKAIVYLIPDHPGYARGTGGTIEVTLHTDDGSAAHNPSSSVLATHVISNVLSLVSPARYFYAIEFAEPPTLTAGQLYHIVFKNVDVSPSTNFLSVDAFYQVTFSSPVQPTIPDKDCAVLVDSGAGWSPRAGYTPIYQLGFPNGVTEGIGYIEGWIGAPQPISGARAIRETFTVSGVQRNVTSVSLRLARVSGNDPLVVRLENADGSLIEEGSVHAATIPESHANSPRYHWATYTFSAAHPLAPGSTYHIDFETSSTSTYQAFPVRKGASYGFSPSTFFTDGYAEFEQNRSWTGWTQWGATNRTDSDLQLYFSVE